MLVKVFDLKKSDIFNHYVAEYHNVKQVTEVGLECEIVTENNEKLGGVLIYMVYKLRHKITKWENKRNV